MTRRSNKTALFLAWRYLFSKKEHNIINVISGISMIGIMVSTAALVVVLSVFNGMSDIIGGWFNALHADYEITLREGKSFATDSFPIQQLRQIPGVKAVNEIVCDLSLANYDDRQELLYLRASPTTTSRPTTSKECWWTATPPSTNYASRAPSWGPGRRANSKSTC